MTALTHDQLPTYRPAGRHVRSHRPGPHHDRNGKPFAWPPVGPDHNPLHPATRQALAPHHYADRQLPAGPDDRTATLNAAQVRALADRTTQGEPATRGEVLAELRGDLDATAPTEGIPAVTGERTDPAQAAVTAIFTAAMTSTEHTR